MRIRIKTIRELKGKLKDKTVLLRTDFNVPLHKVNNKVLILDDYRIKKSLPTIKFLLKEEARIIIISHLGRPLDRPKGVKKEELSLLPIAKKLSGLLKKKVLFSKDCVGEETTRLRRKFEKGLTKERILFLENLRFHKEEENKDLRTTKGFVNELISGADYYVFDAFGVSHREHSSTTLIPKVIGREKTYSGFLVEEEIKQLSSLFNPKKPFIIILGGVKIKTKLPLIKGLVMNNTKTKVLIGGAMMFTFLKALGHETGGSVFVKEELRTAKRLLNSMRDKIILPVDTVGIKKEEFDTAKSRSKVLRKVLKPRVFDFNTNTKKQNKHMRANNSIKPNHTKPDIIGLDIGPKTIELFKNEIKNSRTILWNGPLGYYEIKEFIKGTKEVALSVKRVTKQNKVRSVVCGGDTTAALKGLRINYSSFTFVSTGGGASLYFLANKDLPVLKFLVK